MGDTGRVCFRNREMAIVTLEVRGQTKQMKIRGGNYRHDIVKGEAWKSKGHAKPVPKPAEAHAFQERLHDSGL